MSRSTATASSSCQTSSGIAYQPRRHFPDQHQRVSRDRHGRAGDGLRARRVGQRRGELNSGPLGADPDQPGQYRRGRDLQPGPRRQPAVDRPADQHDDERRSRSATATATTRARRRRCIDSLGVTRTLTTYFHPGQRLGYARPMGDALAAHQFQRRRRSPRAPGPTLTFNSAGMLCSGSGTIAVNNLPNGAAALNITSGFHRDDAVEPGVRGQFDQSTTATAAVSSPASQIASNGTIIGQYSQRRDQDCSARSPWRISPIRKG